jgi:hypothetical protein
MTSYDERGYTPGEKIHNKPREWTVTEEFVSQEIVDELIAAHDKQEAEKRDAEERRLEVVSGNGRLTKSS